jgi:hypothetical protein
MRRYLSLFSWRLSSFLKIGQKDRLGQVKSRFVISNHSNFSLTGGLARNMQDADTRLTTENIANAKV